MTDEQIIKALECCIKNELLCDGKCPGQMLDGDYRNECRLSLMKQALDLIKNQKAEIEILIRKKETLRDEIAEQQAEIERLKNAYKQCAWERDVFSKDANTIKSEAYREFADLLKSKADRGFWQEHGYVDTDDIDNLLKELEEAKLKGGGEG